MTKVVESKPTAPNVPQAKLADPAVTQLKNVAEKKANDPTAESEKDPKPSQIKPKSLARVRGPSSTTNPA